jgi:hypothetical protein
MHQHVRYTICCHPSPSPGRESCRMHQHVKATGIRQDLFWFATQHTGSSKQGLIHGMVPHTPALHKDKHLLHLESLQPSPSSVQPPLSVPPAVSCNSQPPAYVPSNTAQQAHATCTSKQVGRQGHTKQLGRVTPMHDLLSMLNSTHEWVRHGTGHIQLPAWPHCKEAKGSSCSCKLEWSKQASSKLKTPTSLPGQQQTPTYATLQACSSKLAAAAVRSQWGPVRALVAAHQGSP